MSADRSIPRDRLLSSLQSLAGNALPEPAASGLAKVRLLLVEDNPVDVDLIQTILSKSPLERFVVSPVGRVAEAREELASGNVDVVLLDLSLPDAEGLGTVEQIHSVAPGVPIVVLTGVDEEALGLEAIRIGAQDYMLKTEVNPRLLRRSIRYAIERQRIDELRSLALCDELTGLLNARGFTLLAEQQLRLAQRAHMGLLLGFLDLDGLKGINDTYGHLEGNRAIVEAAAILRECLRNSDIIGRLGGDEFAVLAVEASSESRGALISRLEQALEAHNACRQHSYRLWFSIGLAAYDPFKPCSLEQLVAQADQQMYAIKKQEVKLSGKPNSAG